MSTLAWNAARLLRPRRKSVRAYCDLDSWSFDPRYTDGKCPICGWVAPGAPTAPLWLVLARRFEWEMAGLVALMAVLAVLALGVIHAAGYRVPWPGVPARAGVPAGVASPARVRSSTSPSLHTPTPSTSARPSRTP